jgi:SAM-dependent methyltransferase
MTSDKRDYLFGAEFAEERSRITGMESLWDPGSRSLLDDLGVGDGWRCLEVGAGGGSLVCWMADRGAHVTAVDIDTRFVEHLESDTIEVRRLDLRTDELPSNAYDLVHARLVLEHLNDRRMILAKLATTLRPGGWIVIEDYDMRSFSWGNQEPPLEASAKAVIAVMTRAGFEPEYGRRIVADLLDRGFTDVRGEGRAMIIDGRSPGFAFFRLSFESVRQMAIDLGVLTVADADATSARLNDEDMPLFTPVMMAGIGRRPA